MASTALRPSAAPGGLTRRLGPAGWALLGITAGAAGLRFSTLGVQSFWHDEAVTVGRVLPPGPGAALKGIPPREAAPPPHYVLARLWSKLFGTSPAGTPPPPAPFRPSTRAPADSGR